MEISAFSPGLIALALCAFAAQAYLLLALWHVLRQRRAFETPGFTPAVSIMKPLCGIEPGLEDCLRSFFELDYPDYEIVFGLSSADDLALKLAESLCAAYPHIPSRIVLDRRRRGANLKVSNLINMYPACRHDLIVVADSDVFVEKATLKRLIANFADSKVGAASCLYQGLATGGLASRLGALFINDWFIPSVLVDVGINGVDGCYGAMLAIRRQVLTSFGGFVALADHLAEDNLIGRWTREKGWAVALSTETVTTLVGEETLGSLLRHELRWARTVRACRLADQIASVVTYPLPILLALLAIEPSWIGTSLVAVYLVLRFTLHFLMAAKLGHSGWKAAWAVPLRECLCFAIWAASLVGKSVHWRGRDFIVTREGRLLPRNEPELLMVEEGILLQERRAASLPE